MEKTCFHVHFENTCFKIYRKLWLRKLIFTNWDAERQLIDSYFGDVLIRKHFEEIEYNFQKSEIGIYLDVTFISLKNAKNVG